MCDSVDDFVRRNNMLVTLRVNWLKEAGFEKKLITFDSVIYLNMRVTFDVFPCNRIVLLKMATKWSELDCNKGDQLENLSTSF